MMMKAIPAITGLMPPRHARRVEIKHPDAGEEGLQEKKGSVGQPKPFPPKINLRAADLRYNTGKQ